MRGCRSRLPPPVLEGDATRSRSRCVALAFWNLWVVTDFYSPSNRRPQPPSEVPPRFWGAQSREAPAESTLSGASLLLFLHEPQILRPKPDDFTAAIHFVGNHGPWVASTAPVTAGSLRRPVIAAGVQVLPSLALAGAGASFCESRRAMS